MSSLFFRTQAVSNLTVRELGHTELQPAAELLGRGMCDNPVNVRVFRVSDRDQRSQALVRFFASVMRSLYNRGLILGAFHGDSLVGVCGVAKPGACQPGLLDKLRIVPSAIFGNPLGTAPRLLRWEGAWARRDPPEPHWHLGPVAVDPQFQGQGIGSTMLVAFCTHVDDCAALSYLETDKFRNIRFYQKFGFTVLAEAKVMGVSNWFLSRPPNRRLPTTVNAELLPVQSNDLPRDIVESENIFSVRRT